MHGLDRITLAPTILGGKACIRGMRIAVSLVVNLVATGMSFDEILADYPDLEIEDIRQALQYAAWAADSVPKASQDFAIAATHASLDGTLREYTAAEIDGFFETDQLDAAARGVAAHFPATEEP